MKRGMELTSGNTGGNYLDLMTQANLGSENNYNTVTARTQQNMIINYDKKTFKVASGNRSKLNSHYNIIKLINILILT